MHCRNFKLTFSLFFLLSIILVDILVFFHDFSFHYLVNMSYFNEQKKVCSLSYMSCFRVPIFF